VTQSEKTKVGQGVTKEGGGEPQERNVDLTKENESVRQAWEVGSLGGDQMDSTTTKEGRGGQ